MDIYPRGTLIANRYEIAFPPLAGGMGVVYFCLDRKEDQPVALKTFRPELLPNRDARERFLHECETWVKLGKHPNIVQCYSVEIMNQGQDVYLVLELIAKDERFKTASLRSWLEAESPMPIRQSLLFSLQIASGMCYASKMFPNFVHRDLKPENILVGADRLSNFDANRIRITDFGLSRIQIDQITKFDNKSDEGKQIADLRHNKLTRGIVGTPLYMAPEQFQMGAIDTRADIYAFGCILFEMLTGYPPVNKSNYEEIMKAHSTGELLPLPHGIALPVRNIVDRCLAVKPAERFANWLDVEKRLLEVYQGTFGEVSHISNVTQLSNAPDETTIGWAYYNLGTAYRNLNKSETALDYLKKGMKIAQTTNDVNLEMSCLQNLSIAYLDMGMFLNAKDGLGQVFDWANKLNDEFRKANILMNLGVAYQKLGELKTALSHYDLALAIYNKFPDPEAEGTILDNMGAIYREFREFSKAIEYHERALSIYKRFGGNRRAECFILGNLGVIYFELGDFQKSIYFNEQALTIGREVGEKFVQENALGEIGLAHRQLGNKKRAMEYFQQALQISSEIIDKDGESRHAFHLATLLVEFGDRDGALTLAKHAAKLCTQTGKLAMAQQINIFVNQLERIASSNDPKNTIQAAFEAFQRAASSQDIQNAIRKYPFMKDEQFIQAVEEIIKERVPLNLRSAFEQRLDWLRQIASK